MLTTKKKNYLYQLTQSKRFKVLGSRCINLARHRENWNIIDKILKDLHFAHSVHLIFKHLFFMQNINPLEEIVGDSLGRQPSIQDSHSLD